MQPRRTVSQYRAIDLSLFALMLIIFETILLKASVRWFPNEPWTVSATAAVTAIVMVRWGPWAAIHAVIGGIVLCTVTRGQWQQYLIYCAGNLAALGVLPLVKRMGWEALRKDILKNLLCILRINKCGKRHSIHFIYIKILIWLMWCIFRFLTF